MHPLEAMLFYQLPCGIACPVWVERAFTFGNTTACIPGAQRPIVLSLCAQGAGGKWGVVQHAGNLNSSQNQIAR